VPRSLGQEASHVLIIMATERTLREEGGKNPNSHPVGVAVIALHARAVRCDALQMMTAGVPLSRLHHRLPAREPYGP
jgi:hypothetical protein